MKSFQNYIYDFQRFGFTFEKIFSRFTGKSALAPRILTVTMPKSGTNLLQRILILHPWLSRSLMATLGRRNAVEWQDINLKLGHIKKGQIVSSHFDFDEELANTLLNTLQFKILLMVRDPRDSIISDMHYIQTWPGHPHKKLIASKSNDKERLLSLIEGKDGIRPIREQIQRFSGWSSVAHIVRFEDVVGSAGGGSDKIQKESIKDIYSYLKIPLSEKQMNNIAKNCRSAKTQTFRTGSIYNYKKIFDDELHEAFNKQADDLLIEMGYKNESD